MYLGPPLGRLTNLWGLGFRQRKVGLLEEVVYFQGWENYVDLYVLGPSSWAPHKSVGVGISSKKGFVKGWPLGRGSIFPRVGELR